MVATAALDLLRREADLAIRMFRESAPTLITRKLRDIASSVYASRDWAERSSVALSADLSGCALAGQPGPRSARIDGARPHQLVRLTPAVVARSEAFLVIPPDHRETVRVRLVMDAVQALFAREHAVLEGSL